MDHKIQDLLNKHEWEIKTLEEIATDIYSGNGVTGDQLGGGDYPAIKNKDIGKLPQQFEKCRSFIDPGSIKNKKYCEYGDLLISNMGGRKDVGKGCRKRMYLSWPRQMYSGEPRYCC